MSILTNLDCRNRRLFWFWSNPFTERNVHSLHTLFYHSTPLLLDSYPLSAVISKNDHSHFTHLLYATITPRISAFTAWQFDSGLVKGSRKGVKVCPRVLTPKITYLYFILWKLPIHSLVRPVLAQVNSPNTPASAVVGCIACADVAACSRFYEVLTRARPGGHICAPHRFFADSKKMAARSAAKFGIAVHLSFAHLV